MFGKQFIFENSINVLGRFLIRFLIRLFFSRSCRAYQAWKLCHHFGVRWRAKFQIHVEFEPGIKLNSKQASNCIPNRCENSKRMSIQTCVRTCLRTCVRACVRITYILACVHACVRACVRTYIHTYVRTYVRLILRLNLFLEAISSLEV